MDKEKTIEDMARNHLCVELDRHCETCIKCSYYEQAERNYEAGYRKADEVRIETAKEIVDYIREYIRYTFFDECEAETRLGIVADVIEEKYGIEVDE